MVTDAPNSSGAWPGTLRTIMAALLAAATGGLCIGLAAVSGFWGASGFGTNLLILLFFPVVGILVGAIPALAVALALALSIRRSGDRPVRLALWLAIGAMTGALVFFMIDQLVTYLGGASYSQAMARLSAQPHATAFWLRRSLPYVAAGVVGTAVLIALLQRRPDRV